MQGFCFALLQCSPYKRLQRVLFRSCSYTAHTAKRHTWLYRRFSCDFPYSTARDTRPTQAAIIPPATRWSTSQRRSTSSAYQIPAPRRTLYSSAQPPYYNKVYKGAAVRRCYGSMPDSAANRRPCQPGGVSVSTCTESARRLSIWHRVSSQGVPGRPGTLHPAGQSSGRGTAARNRWRLPPQLFSGFRPITNRGQQ